MSSRIKRQRFIDNLLSPFEFPFEKSIFIMGLVRGGGYYHSSNARNDLLNEFKSQVSLLSDEETKKLQSLLINDFEGLLQDRINRRIAYSAIFKLIEAASQKSDKLIWAFEEFVLAKAEAYKKHSIEYVMGLAGIETRLLKETSARLHEFVLARYIKPSKHWVDFGRLCAYAQAVSELRKQELLVFLVQEKPYIGDQAVIAAFVRCFPNELERVALLI